jgi:hypothetical protein
MRLTLSPSLLVLLLAPPAAANEIPCSPVEPGTIQFDGLLNDWKGVDGAAVDEASHIIKGKENWSGADDLSFEVYCNHDDKMLYLAIDVRDEYFIRTSKKGSAGDDHIIVHFTGKQLFVFPGDLRGIAGRVSWGKAGKAKGVQMAEAMQKKGYSVELGIPLKAIPGYRAGVPSIPGAIWVADSDSKAKGKTETIMATAASAKQGSFSFAQAKADLTAFLKDKGYSAKDVRTKINADVVGDGRQEQVLLAGKTIGIVGDGVPGGGYVFLDIGVQQGKDIYWLKVMDINGDGKGEIVTRYAERSRNGRRELLAVYRLDDGGKFTRPFAHEILKGQGERVITNRYVFKPRKRKGRKKAGVDFLFDKPAAKGFTVETYHESPASDCFPILLPWSETKKRTFRFDGDDIQEL